MQTKRLAYIDTVKGVMIMFVLYTHFLGFSVSSHNFLSELFELTAMPAFFLVSGYLSKTAPLHNIKEIGISIYNKALRLLLPTFSCLVLFILAYKCYPNNDSLSSELIFTDRMWKGYWFTPTLFAVILWSTLFREILPKSLFSVFNLAIALFLPIVMHILFRLHIVPSTNILCINQSLEYFQYFSLGIVLQTYDTKISKYLDKQYFSLGILVVCTIDLIGIGLYGTNRYIPFCFSRLMFAFGAFLLFRSSSEYWEKKSRGSSFIQLVGKNSLGIYLLHYFILPHHMQYLAPYVEKDVFLQILLGCTVALLMTIFILIVIRIIHKSRILSLILLGEIRKQE